MVVKREKNYFGWYFLLAVFALYILLGIFNPEIFRSVGHVFWKIFKRVGGVFVLVWGLMVLVNYYFTPDSARKFLVHLRGWRGWVAAILAGIISSGPIYMWYPLLRELRKQGVAESLLIVFLYNRAVKPALLPMLIVYFGLKFTLVLTFVMVGASILQGLIYEKIIERRKNVTTE